VSDAPRDLAASVRARLNNRAREQGRPFQELLQYFAIERFLYRLAQSRYRQSFVLKGGVVFFSWGISLRRPTRDIDLHGYAPAPVEILEDIIREVCGQPVEADGMHYAASSVHGEVIQDQAEYEGVRIRFTGYLGTARVHMQIDVGFSDVIEVHPKTCTYFSGSGVILQDSSDNEHTPRHLFSNRLQFNCVAWWRGFHQRASFQK
jgi:hypothetical protein